LQTLLGGNSSPDEERIQPNRHKTRYLAGVFLGPGRRSTRPSTPRMGLNLGRFSRKDQPRGRRSGGGETTTDQTEDHGQRQRHAHHHRDNARRFGNDAGRQHDPARSSQEITGTLREADEEVVRQLVATRNIPYGKQPGGIREGIGARHGEHQGGRVRPLVVARVGKRAVRGDVTSTRRAGYHPRRARRREETALGRINREDVRSRTSTRGVELERGLQATNQGAGVIALGTECGKPVRRTMRSEGTIHRGQGSGDVLIGRDRGCGEDHNTVQVDGQGNGSRISLSSHEAHDGAQGETHQESPMSLHVE